MISSLPMSGLFSQVFSLGAEPVYLGNEFSFSSSYSRGKLSMSSCVLQQLLANKTVLVQFFPDSFASKFEMTQILFVPRSCGLSFASRFIGCWLWFHDSLILCCSTSLEILSLVLPVRFFFYSWWAPIAWNSFYKPAFDHLLPMEIVLLSGVLRSRRSTVQDGTRRKSSQSLE